ncbi:helix-turn-helix transcriptional regulator [Salipiger sp. 1_MG-2023]|uniref:helix-turn-helix transcriptional regulator n=1 Tax=Salipiger sp. 1_MG-2023 TaxID=3062665 RepID=UPI0026E2F6B8|nr:helix-turn-helix transcriptional regulator [Salipiger sp. 1_MG-2023]MDO6584326.1 helix-turn-helix transcriptional regulator [Salipiger sp. 1_MG-2023]
MRDLPNLSETFLGDAIAALNTDGFAGHLFQWLTRCFEIDNTTMLAYFQERSPQLLFSHAREPRVHERIVSDYLTGAYLLDPFHALHIERAAAGLYRMRDIAPDQFTRNEYFATYYQETTMCDEIAYVGYPAPGVSVHVCLGRDASSARVFSPRDLERAQRLAPIACALIERNWAGLRSEGAIRDSDVSGALQRRVAADRGIALTDRQAEIALLVLKGHSSSSIAMRLEISPQTVKVFRKQLYRKCDISSQAELFSMMMPLLSSLDL